MSTDFKVQIIIPFRLREGADLRRAANLEAIMTWWWAHGFTPEVVDDGLSGDEQFNRHAAYNLAVSRNPDVDVFIFTEADMLIPANQIIEGARMAHQTLGLVVPFLQYRYLNDANTGYVRHMLGTTNPNVTGAFIEDGDVFDIAPESTMEGGKSIGAVNIVSAETLRVTGGFTEATSGNWYDDRIIEEGFAYLTGKPTRYVQGPAVHMYHLPGWSGDHLTTEDKAATMTNKSILLKMRDNIRYGFHAPVKALMEVRS